jgi:hypothetical protein
MSASSTWNSGDGFVPIGKDSGIPFTGHFDGNGHTISNLTIDRPLKSMMGLFGAVENATISDVTITNANVTGYRYVGILAGAAYNSTITECSTSGSLGAVERGGGLIGYSTSDVTNSNSSATISGTSGYSHSLFGGLIGDSRGDITKSYATGSVTGTTDIGGLVGKNQYATISQSYATGTVSGTTNIGGLAGISTTPAGSILTQIEQSYATGDVSGGEHVGGLVGFNSQARIYDSYSQGNVTGTGTSSYIGGLVGLAESTSTNSSTYTKIERNYVTGTASGSTNVGAVIGSLTSVTQANNYWNSETGGPDNSIGTGASTTEMRSQSTYSNFDFSSVWLLVGDAYFPELRNNQKSSYSGMIFTNGSGYSANPYQITTIEQLHAVRAFASNHFILMNDLDLTSATGTSGGKYWNGGVGFTPIGLGSDFFKGTFNGNHKTITGLHINNSEYYTGLFASLSGGWIADLTLEDVDITGSGTEVGALTGRVSVEEFIV